VAGVPLYRLSKVWSINRESLRNHREKHISKAEVPLRLARVESNDPRRPTLDEVEELLAQGRRMYEAAAAVQNMPLSLKSAHLILAALELKARMTRELDERTQVTVLNVMQSPAFVFARTIIFEELEDYPDVRHNISVRLRAAAAAATAEAS
jgi:predicted nucleotidyltransferase